MGRPARRRQWQQRLGSCCEHSTLHPLGKGDPPGPSLGPPKVATRLEPYAPTPGHSSSLRCGSPSRAEKRGRQAWRARERADRRTGKKLADGDPRHLATVRGALRSKHSVLGGSNVRPFGRRKHLSASLESPRSPVFDRAAMRLPHAKALANARAQKSSWSRRATTSSREGEPDKGSVREGPVSRASAVLQSCRATQLLTPGAFSALQSPYSDAPGAKCPGSGSLSWPSRSRFGRANGSGTRVSDYL